MDSMRSLNTSLPSSQTQQPRPPEQLLQAFKTAALSVTNLYKTAALDQRKIRSAGYQEALDELLQFLDKENLGLGDGEGWRVRQWATERLDGGAPGHPGSDSDEDAEEGKRHMSPSPVVQFRPSQDVQRTAHVLKLGSPPRSESAPPIVSAISASTVPIQQSEATPAHVDSFTFRSPHMYPSPTEMDLGSTEQTSEPCTSTITSPANLRQARSVVRHMSQSGRANGRASSSGLSLGTSAGSKRRMPFGDFFDIGGLSNDRDKHGGGGKRTRFM